MIPVHATADDAGRSPYPDTASKWGGLGSEDPVLRSDENTFTGYDGATYSRAGWTVKGRRGAVYLGEEFDSACLTGDRFGQALGRLAQFARVIRASGRTVIFTVAPSKSAVYKKDLPTSMPHGSCDAQGIAAQDRVLDTFSDPSYIPLRKQMATMMDRGTPAYWRLDSHWTTVGSTRWG